MFRTFLVHEVRKFFLVFYSARSNSDHFAISNFSSFPKKINFTCEKSEVSKKSFFSALSYCKVHFRTFYDFKAFPTFFFFFHCLEKSEKLVIRKKIVFIEFFQTVFPTFFSTPPIL